MTILLTALFIVFALFVFVIAFGAPYLPTLSKRVDDALDLLDLRPGQTMLELGSGDGRLLRAAARRGIHSVGYELNPLLVLWAKLLSWRQRDMVSVRLANYWQKEWPKADGIYVFLLNPFMLKLDKQIVQYVKKMGKNKQLKLVSFAFQVPGKKHSDEKQGMFLYKY